MEFDCSITKRQGCNYCSRGKEIPNIKGKLHLYIGKCSKQLQVDSDNLLCVENINIFYCPVCGKKLE